MINLISDNESDEENVDSDVDQNTSESEENVVEVPHKQTDAINCIKRLREFMIQTNCSEISFEYLNKLEDEVLSKSSNVLDDQK